MIKIYLGRFLQSGLLLMLNLIVSIFASTILFTSLKTIGLSDKGSLLIAFFVLVGLIILGFLLYPKSIPQLKEVYHPSVLLRWLLPQYRRSKKAEELTKGLEQLSQTLIAHEVFLAQLIRDARYASSSPIAFERLTTVIDNLSNNIVRERETLTASQSQLINQFTAQLQVFSENLVRESQRFTNSRSQLLDKLTDHFGRQEVQLDLYATQLAHFQDRLAEVLTHYDQLEVELQQRIGDLEQILIAKSYRDRGIYLLRLNRHVEALPIFQQATQLNPNDAVAYRELGVTLLDLKRHEEALPAFQQATQLDPNDAIAHRELGITLLDLKRHEEALPHFNLATQLDPNDAVAYRELGVTLLDLKRHEEALRAFDKSININPRDAAAYNFKGVTLRDLGKINEAVLAFEKARQLGYDGNGTSTTSSRSADLLPLLPSTLRDMLRDAYLDAAQSNAGKWVALSRLGLSMRKLYPDFKVTDYADNLFTLVKQYSNSFEIDSKANSQQVRLKIS